MSDKHDELRRNSWSYPKQTGGVANLDGVVTSVNGAVPDENGNVEVEVPSDAVSYNQQELTESQQMQARKNQGLYRTDSTVALVYEGHVDSNSNGGTKNNGSVNGNSGNVFCLNSNTVGKTYIVEHDGVEYECVVYKAGFYIPGMGEESNYFIGNCFIQSSANEPEGVTAEEITKYPFCFYGGSWYYYPDNDPHDFKITSMEVEFVPVEPEYILGREVDETDNNKVLLFNNGELNTADPKELVSVSWDDLDEKPFEEVFEKNIYSKTLTIYSALTMVTLSTDPIDLTIGYTYEVTLADWNAEKQYKYTCECRDCGEPNGIPVLGNDNMNIYRPSYSYNEGELPFFLEGGRMGTRIVLATSNYTYIQIRLLPGFKTIDPAFITGTELTEADNGKLLGVSDGKVGLVDAPSDGVTSWNDLEDKPFGITYKKNSTYELYTGFTGNEGTVSNKWEPSGADGSIFIVMLSDYDEEFVTTKKVASDQSCVIGNPVLFPNYKDYGWTSADDTGEPFCLFYQYDPTAYGAFLDKIYVNCGGSNDSHEIMLYKAVEAIDKIHYQYLPSLGVCFRSDGEKVETKRHGSSNVTYKDFGDAYRAGNICGITLTVFNETNGAIETIKPFVTFEGGSSKNKIDGTLKFCWTIKFDDCEVHLFEDDVVEIQYNE